MERHKLIKQFVDFLFFIVVAGLFFWIGKTIGIAQTEVKYEASPCFKK